MKIKRISKGTVKIFLASFLMTTFFITALFSFVVVEKNSLKTGVREIENPLALYTTQEEILLVVNDRELMLSLKPLKDAVKSRGFAALMLVILSL